MSLTIILSFSKSYLMKFFTIITLMDCLIPSNCKETSWILGLIKQKFVPKNFYKREICKRLLLWSMQKLSFGIQFFLFRDKWFQRFLLWLGDPGTWVHHLKKFDNQVFNKIHYFCCFYRIGLFKLNHSGNLVLYKNVFQSPILFTIRLKNFTIREESKANFPVQ